VELCLAIGEDRGADATGAIGRAVRHRFRADRVRADQAGRAMLFQAAQRQDDAAPALRESRFEDRQAHFGEAHR
jgi:hypothetical protein